MEHPIVLAFSLYGAQKSIRIDELLYDILVESRYYMSNFVQDTTHKTLSLDRHEAIVVIDVVPGNIGSCYHETQ